MPMTPSKRRRAAWLLALAFGFCLLMGAGPGLLLVNDGGIDALLSLGFFRLAWNVEPASQVLGFPTLYVWGVLWFLGEVAVVVTAFALLWRDDDSSREAP